MIGKRAPRTRVIDNGQVGKVMRDADCGREERVSKGVRRNEEPVQASRVHVRRQGVASDMEERMRIVGGVLHEEVCPESIPGDREGSSRELRVLAGSESLSTKFMSPPTKVGTELSTERRDSKISVLVL